MPEMRLGFVELTQDTRYDADKAYARIPLRAAGRPFVGSQVGMAEAESIGRMLKIRFSMEHAAADTVDELARTVRRWVREQDVHFVVTDLPADALTALATQLAGEPVLLLNATAADDALRGALCKANIVHVTPSVAMLSDALVQYLVTRRWTSILVLQGPLPEDAAMVAALQRSASKFGAKIVEVRPFELSNDPRQREKTNVALLTGNVEHDVVFVADTDGEFGRYVPYATQRPRPVVGSTSLVADGWHWAWERNGGPQLNSRFDKAAGRRMVTQDWSAWAAVKAVVQAVLRTRGTAFEANRDYILGDKMTLDGVKGNPMSVRPWDHQLRQPLFVATSNAVIERAPLRGFLHQKNELDTLGFDEPETKCRM